MRNDSKSQTSSLLTRSHLHSSVRLCTLYILEQLARISALLHTSRPPPLPSPSHPSGPANSGSRPKASTPHSDRPTCSCPSQIGTCNILIRFGRLCTISWVVRPSPSPPSLLHSALVSATSRQPHPQPSQILLPCYRRAVSRSSTSGYWPRLVPANGKIASPRPPARQPRSTCSFLVSRSFVMCSLCTEPAVGVGPHPAPAP